MPTAVDLRASADCAAIARDKLGIGVVQPDAMMVRRSVKELRAAILAAYEAGVRYRPEQAPVTMEKG